MQKLNVSGDMDIPGRPGKVRRMDILLENLKRYHDFANPH